MFSVLDLILSSVKLLPFHTSIFFCLSLVSALPLAFSFCWGFFDGVRFIALSYSILFCALWDFIAPWRLASGANSLRRLHWNERQATESHFTLPSSIYNNFSEIKQRDDLKFLFHGVKKQAAQVHTSEIGGLTVVVWKSAAVSCWRKASERLGELVVVDLAHSFSLSGSNCLTTSITSPAHAGKFSFTLRPFAERKARRKLPWLRGASERWSWHINHH